MKKPKKPVFIEREIEFTPEGACGPINFHYGSSCGRQETPSVGIHYMCAGDGFRGGVVMTRVQVAQLYEFLGKCIERFPDDMTSYEHFEEDMDQPVAENVSRFTDILH